MWAMGTFPRKKGFVDFKSIKYTINIVKSGYSLVIYPEVGRNWDGETLPILKSIAKLVKLLNMPLVTAVLKGYYLAYPRWTDKKRKSVITIYYSKPVFFDRNTSDETIISHIQNGIYNNDNYTLVNKIKGKNPARGLPRLLWRCPSCRTIDALTEKDGSHIVCSHCGIEWEVNLHCFMKKKGANSWKPIKEYSDKTFRKEEIVPLDLDPPFSPGIDEHIYLKSNQVILYNEPRYPKLKKVDSGTLYLTSSRLIFVPFHKNEQYSYLFQDIRGRSTEQNFIFQIVLDDTIGRFEMPYESCYKWEVVYDYVRKNAGFDTEEG